MECTNWNVAVFDSSLSLDLVITSSIFWLRDVVVDEKVNLSLGSPLSSSLGGGGTSLRISLKIRGLRIVLRVSFRSSLDGLVLLKNKGEKKGFFIEWSKKEGGKLYVHNICLRTRKIEPFKMQCDISIMQLGKRDFLLFFLNALC